MSQALDVVILKEIGLSTVVIEGEIVHLLHVRNLRGKSGTFGLGQEHLTALIARAQECVNAGLKRQLEDD